MHTQTQNLLCAINTGDNAVHIFKLHLFFIGEPHKLHHQGLQLHLAALVQFRHLLLDSVNIHDSDCGSVGVLVGLFHDVSVQTSGQFEHIWPKQLKLGGHLTKIIHAGNRIGGSGQDSSRCSGWLDLDRGFCLDLGEIDGLLLILFSRWLDLDFVCLLILGEIQDLCLLGGTDRRSNDGTLGSLFALLKDTIR